MNHENNCKDLIWKTLILKSTCQHKKKTVETPTLGSFPTARESEHQTEKNIRTGASKIYF